MEEIGAPSRRGAAPGRDWTKGNVFHNLLSLSWPMVVSNTLMMLGPTIDMVWVGKLGTASIAGVGVAGIAVQLVMVGLMGLSMGMRAMVARFIGAGDIGLANHVARQAFAISGIYAVLMAVIGVLYAERILGLFGLEPDVVAEGSAYMRIMFVGAAAMSFRLMAEGIMQASGDTVTPMAISVVYRLFHVALCPFLIFGWWIFPRMGVSGAAMTNVVSQSLGLGLGLFFLFSGRSLFLSRWSARIGWSRLRLSLRNFHLDPNIIWRIVRIGLPSLVSGIQRTFSHFFLMWFMAGFGTFAVAAHTVNQRIEMMLFMPGMAFGMASGVLVGQNLGAQQPERAEKSAWLAVAVVEGVMVIAAMVMLLWAESIVRIFNTEPSLVATAATFMRIAVIGYILLGFMSVLMQSLSGAGDTMPTMIISVVTVWTVTLPLAYFLPRVTDLGVYAVRWAMVAGMVTGAITYTIYFRMGRWKRKKV